MLLPNPESPYSPRHIERVHSMQRLKAAGHLALTALLGLSPYASVYSQDVQRNIEVQQEAEIDIQRLYEPLDSANQNTAIITIDGFGSYNANTVAKYLGPVAQEFMDGQIWSVEYGNAVLESEAITEKVVELAKAYNVDTVGILGYSAGGNVGARVADELLHKTDLEVPLILAVSTPSGVDGLRELQLKEIEVAQTIEHIPGATHSSFVRYIGEMYFRRDRYDEGNLWERAIDAVGIHNWVIEDLQKDTLPGTWLLIDQVNVITNSRLEERFASIGEATDKIPPTVVYLGTAEPGYDYVVNDDLSGANICRYARQSGLNCYNYAVPGAVHTRPDLANDSYLQTAKQIASMIRFALERAQIPQETHNTTPAQVGAYQ